jgi:hypothetical protein
LPTFRTPTGIFIQTLADFGRLWQTSGDQNLDFEVELISPLKNCGLGSVKKRLSFGKGRL